MPVHVNKVPPFAGETFNQRCLVFKAEGTLGSEERKKKAYTEKNRSLEEKVDS